MSLVVSFLLLSASHEGLFILALILNMFCWLLLELHSADSSKNKVMDVVRIVLPVLCVLKPVNDPLL
jgi:hypothetical protein